MAPTINDILSNPAQSRKTIIDLSEENRKSKLEVDYLKERIALLTHQLYGKKSKKTGNAEVAIDFTQKLYQIERTTKEQELSEQELLEVRQEKSKPLLRISAYGYWTDKPVCGQRAF